MTPTPHINISVCSPSLFCSEIPELVILLKETVDENVPINFCLPFSLGDAENWWRGLEGGINAGKQLLILAHIEETEKTKQDRRLVGCVVLYLAQHTNATHRGEVGKLLVKKDERRRQVDTQKQNAIHIVNLNPISGIGKLLMECLEDQARKHDRWMLVSILMSSFCLRISSCTVFVHANRVSCRKVL